MDLPDSVHPLPEQFEKCPIIYAMELIGAKWKIPILWNLSDEDGLHYNELKRRVQGVTNTTLTRCLRELERNGIIYRVIQDTTPPTVAYYLNDDGKQLMTALNDLYTWGETHMNKQL